MKCIFLHHGGCVTEKKRYNTVHSSKVFCIKGTGKPNQICQEGVWDMKRWSSKSFFKILEFLLGFWSS
jgi:hypothetical protein